MTKFRLARIAAVSVMALSFALPASAVTVAELQAQINALMAQLSSLQGAAPAASVTFTNDLTIGSKGTDVTALQNWLISKSFSIPAGATGYFGSQTKAAVAAWQASANISPAVGYFGPISRGVVNQIVGGPIGVPAPGAVCPAGFTCTSNTSGGVITTPGAEGTLSVTAGTVSNSIVYAGDQKAAALVFKVKAQSSDIAIQRVKLDLGTNSKIYKSAYSKIYLVDEAGATLASSDLNSDTVVLDAGIYYITLTGFSSVVPKDATRTFTVKVDVQDFSSTDTDTDNDPWIIRLALSGVRGVDGAGIDQYAGSTAITKTLTTNASLTESASLSLSTGANTPLTQEVVAAGGSANNQADKVTLLTFDLQAKKDTVLLTDIVAHINNTSGGATASSTYLYVGDTLVGTATVGQDKLATFSDIDYSIPKDTTKTFTLKADISGTVTSQTTITATIAGTVTDITAENSAGDTITNTYLSGSATSNNILVTNVGPIFSLVGTPTIVRTNSAVGSYSTSTAAATFQLHIKAVGSSILFGNLSSTTPMVSNKAGVTRSFIPYANGTAVVTGQLFVASTTDWTVPSSGVSVGTADSFTLAQDAEITIPVTFSMQGNLTTGAAVTYGSYAVGLERVNWVSASGLNASTFMAGLTGWRTASVTLP